MEVNELNNKVLTKRQTEITAKVAQGKTTAEIAVEINRSESTVNKAIDEAIKRLNAENRANLVALAILKGIISVKGFALVMGLLGAMVTDDDMRNVRQARSMSRMSGRVGRNWEMRV